MKKRPAQSQLRTHPRRWGRLVRLSSVGLISAVFVLGNWGQIQLPWLVTTVQLHDEAEGAVVHLARMAPVDGTEPPARTNLRSRFNRPLVDWGTGESDPEDEIRDLAQGRGWDDTAGVKPGNTLREEEGPTPSKMRYTPKLSRGPPERGFSVSDLWLTNTGSSAVSIRTCGDGNASRPLQFHSSPAENFNANVTDPVGFPIPFNLYRGVMPVPVTAGHASPTGIGLSFLRNRFPIVRANQASLGQGGIHG